MRRATPYSVFLVATGATFYLYEFFLRVLPAVFSQEIMTHLQIHATCFGITTAAFFLSYVPMQVPAGLLGDHFGPKRILAFMTALAGASCLIFVHADHWPQAAFARGLMGFGASFAYLAPLMLAARWLPARHFALTAGLVQAMGCAGALFGTRPVTLLADHYGWLNTLKYAGYAGFALAIILLLTINDHPDPNHDVQQNVKGSWQNLCRVIRSPQAWYTGLVAFATWAPMSIFTELWGTPFLTESLDISTDAAAHDTGWVWWGVALGGPQFGHLTTLWERRKPPLILGLSLSFVMSLLITYATNMPATLLSCCLFLLGIGCGVQAVTFGLVRDHNQSDTAGTASGFNNMILVMGAMTLQPFTGFLLDQIDHHPQIFHYTTHAFHGAFVLIPLSILMGLLITWFALKETYAQPQSTTTL